MSSWELGKIFAVDENKESDQNDDDPNYVSDSDSESEDDEDARARAAAFAKSKRSNTTCPVTGSNRSIRRYDEYGSFITRSERARKEKTEELPPSAIKDSKDGKEKIVKGKGKVCFRGGSLGIGEGLLDIKEIPEWTEDEKMLLFMTRANCKKNCSWLIGRLVVDLGMDTRVF